MISKKNYELLSDYEREIMDILALAVRDGTVLVKVVDGENVYSIRKEEDYVSNKISPTIRIAD